MSVVGGHLNVRRTVSESSGHRQPALRGGGCLQGHCCCCYSVHCPGASGCHGNRPFWASHISAWQCPVVGLLGATEQFGRPCCGALTWNTGNCLLFDEVIKNNLTRSDPTRARANSRALRTLWLGPGLGGTRPSHQKSTEPSSARSPHRGAAHSRSHRGLGRAGQGREWLGPAGAGAKGKGPGRAAHVESSAERSIWLRSGCLVRKGSLAPPTDPRPHYCKRRPSLKGTPVTLRHQGKSCSERRLPQKENGSRGGAPESRDRDAGGRTDVLLKEAKEASV
ncbi:hypothetical protein HJG60_011611 [Phyllostomus discolor]|uniref:Uncharacterized protein n=1 Tax=Phyllostomus discolor TaxID=89673 RepID=A0A833ZZB6_9CHIR|nr:hypothetical protein HJG60_011611 [Phyllostomus discolor]